MDKLSKSPKWYRHFFAALKFLTTLPLGASQVFQPRIMLAWFAPAGLAIGVILSLFDNLALRILPGSVVSGMDVILLAAITGGLHLDGLADTADGLYGQHGRQRALEIMKDSRVGAMGAIALVTGLIIKTSAIANITANRWLWLLLAPAYARGSVLFAVAMLPYCRPEGGTGEDFCKQPPAMVHHLSLVAVVALSTLGGFQALVVNLGYAALAVGILLYYRRKMGCITGDMLGAMIEFMETGLLVAACIRTWT